MIWGYPYFWQDLKPPIAIVNQELPIPSLGTQKPLPLNLTGTIHITKYTSKNTAPNHCQYQFCMGLVKTCVFCFFFPKIPNKTRRKSMICFRKKLSCSFINTCFFLQMCLPTLVVIIISKFASYFGLPPLDFFVSNMSLAIVIDSYIVAV